MQKNTASNVIESGSRKVTGLVVDFLQECAVRHQVKFHAPVLFGLRQHIGLRGLYLAEGFKVKRNKPIFTIPYSGMLTTENIVEQPLAPKHVTLEKVRETLIDDEIKLLAPHLLFGIHFAHQVSLLPKHGTTLASLAEQGEKLDKETYDKQVQLFTGGIMPWARMLDDENWMEEHVLGMHRGALDKWQLQDYTDVLNMFNRNITELHTKLQLETPTDGLRRIARVVLARTEQVPAEKELCASRLTKMCRKLYRSMQKDPAAKKPHPELRMVPLIDMLNHSNRANTLLRIFPDGEKHVGVKGPCVSLYALQDIEGGNELCRYYNFGMSRGNALFRYGFLPFEMLALEHFDPWKEHYAKNIAPNLMPETPEEQKRRVEIEREVSRLQNLFSSSRDGKNNSDKK